MNVEDFSLFFRHSGILNNFFLYLLPTVNVTQFPEFGEI